MSVCRISVDVNVCPGRVRPSNGPRLLVCVFWEQSERRNGRRICIWLDVDNGDDYFVILYVHRRYVRLLTAFYGDSPNYAKKRLKEYEDWKEKVGRDFTPDELVSDIISRMPEPEEEGQAK